MIKLKIGILVLSVLTLPQAAFGDYYFSGDFTEDATISEDTVILEGDAKISQGVTINFEHSAPRPEFPTETDVTLTIEGKALMHSSMGALAYLNVVLQNGGECELYAFDEYPELIGICSYAIAIGSMNLQVLDDSLLTLAIYGEEYAFFQSQNRNNVGDIYFENASNLALDLGRIETDESATSLCLRFIEINNFSSLFVRVGDMVLDDVDDMTQWNEAFANMTILGYEDWEKSFAYDRTTRTILLNLSQIPEPSAFGLLAGAFALALCAARRRRRSR